MAIQVRERTIEEIEKKLASMATSFNKILYLESALKCSTSNFEIKRFLWGELALLYNKRKMFERAAKALENLASMEPIFRDRMDSYLMSAEMLCRVGKISDADDMFRRAMRDAGELDKKKILLARKNIYFKFATELEDSGKRAKAVKFYEKLNKIKLEKIEKEKVVEKLKISYRSLGMFREERLLSSS